VSSLIVNVDMIATSRETRGLGEPDPAQAAVLAEMAGADGIAVQVRQHRRGIRERDLYVLRSVTKTRLTVEMPAVDEIMAKVIEVKPWMVTLVADRGPNEVQVSPVTFDATEIDYGEVAARLQAAGVGCALFVEPDVEVIKHAARSTVTAVLLNAEHYSQARTLDQAQEELDRLDQAAGAAAKAGLSVHCGRGLDLRNIRPLVELKMVDEFVIGYSIFTRALLLGYQEAVKEMLRALR